jgi:hypothetical protein
VGAVAHERAVTTACAVLRERVEEEECAIGHERAEDNEGTDGRERVAELCACRVERASRRSPHCLVSARG